MIQHVVLINFRSGVPSPVKDECRQRLQMLKTNVPGLRAWRVGCNATTMDRAWDLAVTGEFDDLDAVAAYRAHPAHIEAQHFVDQYATDTIGVDFEPETT